MAEEQRITRAKTDEVEDIARRGEPATAEEDQDLPEPSEEQEEAARVCKRWLDRDREAKDPIVEEFDELDKLYANKHWDMLSPTGDVLRSEEQQKNRPNAVEAIAWATVESLVSEFSQDWQMVDFPRERGDDEPAQLMTDVKEHIAYQNEWELEQEDALRNFFWYGTMVLHPYWDPLWRGGRGPNRWEGDIRWRSLDPRTVVPDARCGRDINTARRVSKIVFTTVEQIQEDFPQFGHLVPLGDADTSMITNEAVDDEEQMAEQPAQLVETWYAGRPLLPGKDGKKGTEKGLHVIWWANANRPIYLKHANYVYNVPGQTPQYPFIFRQRYPRKINGRYSIWGYGEAHYIKWPQIFLNKMVELIIEGNWHAAIGQTFYGEGAVSPEQEKRIVEEGALPGMWFKVQNPELIKREFGKGIPASVANEVQRITRTIETIVGRFDISQGKTPGSVTAFRALDLLAQRAMVRLRSAEKIIKSAFQALGSYTNDLITLNYTEARTFRIRGEQPDESKYFQFRAQQIQRVHIFQTKTVVAFQDFDPATYFPPEQFPEGPVEGRDYEVYSPEFDTEVKMSTTMPGDRMFYMEVAKELYQAKLIDPETFFYVLDNGRFPPTEELLERLQGFMQQMMANGQTLGPPQAPPRQPADMQALVEQVISSLSPEQQQELASLDEVGRQEAVQAILQEQGITG